jgi:predicted protein tyrosine phosphatase
VGRNTHKRESEAGGGTMNFIVTDRASIEAGIVVRTAYAVISIRDPGKRKARVHRGAGLVDILYRAFHDAEPCDGESLPLEVVPMTLKDARAIWKFAKQNRFAIGTIVCHCEQGMSRSPAVALALAEELDGDASGIHANSQPNQYVYQLVREAIKESPI